ncbi:putative tRNA N6-adenosine threonylcarbamoyltransferase [Mactra antiquata]
MVFNHMTFSMFRYCKTAARILNNSRKIDKYPVYSLSDFTSAAPNKTRARVLGIETSCDDTGAAVVDSDGNIVGNALHSQTSVSVALGGVLPRYARAIHQQHIKNVVKDALCQANIQVKDLDAIAVTVKPGLAPCLEVGLTHAKRLVEESRVPMIPIHHMEAHALTARMIEQIAFPFLVLLVSGGHCLLSVAKDIDDFLLLGTCLDSSPGEAFDKVARRLKLKNLPQCNGLSGGGMIELLARDGDIEAIPAPNVHSDQNASSFSFAGIKSQYLRYIEEEEIKQGIVASHVISNASDMCASFQYAVLKHLAKRLQRAFIYCDTFELLPEHNKTLVISGGVACNQFLRQGLQKVCDHYNSRLICPPPHLCTDNGIMIAWNGMEKLKAGRGFAEDPLTMRYTPKSPFGTDITAEVAKVSIKLPKLKLL